MRGDDLVARLGGDEFAIVAAGADDPGMEALAKRVAARLEEADGRLGLTDYRLSASFGWALYPRDADSSERLVAKADLALRQAKAEAGPSLAGRDAGPVSPLPRDRETRELGAVIVRSDTL